MFAVLFAKKRDCFKPYGSVFIQASFAKPCAHALSDDRTEGQPVDRLGGCELAVTKLAKHRPLRINPRLGSKSKHYS
jgi:hypothetical protein